MQPCNFLISSGPASGNLRYHCHLMMCCYYLCPTLWVGGSDNTQFVMDSLDDIVLVAHSKGLVASQKSVSEKESGVQRNGEALLQSPKGQSCSSPTGSCLRLQVAYLSALTLESLPSTGSCDPSSRAAGTAAWTCGRAFGSVLHSKPAGFMHLGWDVA